MHYEILESARFPEVTFTALRVTGRVARQGSSQVEVQGVMKLHGSEHELTSIAEIAPDGEHWKAHVHFVVPYVAWGLKNPSNFFLRVNKEVNIDVQATGRLSGLAAE
jgi:polyisoprenoid-binding protein YceI